MKHRTERNQIAQSNTTESILSSSICFQTRNENSWWKVYLLKSTCWKLCDVPCKRNGWVYHTVFLKATEKRWIFPEGTEDTSSLGVNCSHHISVTVITRPLKQLWALSPVCHSGLKWKGDSLHLSQMEKRCPNNNLRALPGILIYKWTLGTKTSASLKPVLGGR